VRQSFPSMTVGSRPVRAVPVRDLSQPTRRTEKMDRRRFLFAAASGAAALATEPWALAARAGGTPLAFVTADLESHVAVVRLSALQLRIIERIRTGPGPRSIEAAHNRFAVVGHSEHGVVTILDTFRRRIRAELEGFAEPRYAAIHPRRALAYVTDSAAEELVTLDLERRRVRWRTRVPGPARHVSISPDGSTVWAVLGNASPRVAVLDTSDALRPKLVRTVAPPFLAHDVVFAPDGRTVWVTSGAEGRVVVYSRERRERRVLAAGSPPQHVTFAERKVFVASGDDGTVRRHRADGGLVRQARVPVGSYNLTFGWGVVASPSLTAGTLSVLRGDGRVAAVRAVARAAHDACVVVGP
jgi:DNA-binding beta-propeller fold protein YncE